MPLTLCTVFFIVLFSLESFWQAAEAEYERRSLERYHQVEHSRHRRSDGYLDIDWN